MSLFSAKAVSIAVASAYSLTLPTVAAQTAPDQTQIERVSIVGARTPAPTHQLASASYVLDQAAISSSGQLYLADLLRGMPGISISSSGSVGGLTEVRLRGGETNHLLVMIDGVVVNDEGQGGFVDFAHISTQNIVRVELLQGPQSALWGSGAVAGVLSITTTGGQPATRISASAGNHGQYAADLSTSQREINTHYGNVTYNANLSHQRSDGTNVSRQGDEDDGYRNTTLGGSVNWQLNDQHTLTASVRSVDYRTEFDGVDFAVTGLPVDADNVSEGQQYSGKVGWQYNPQNSRVKHTLDYQYSKNQVENFSAGTTTAETDTNKQRALYYASIAMASESTVNVGAEWVRDEFSQRGPVGFSDPNQDQAITSYAALADAVIALNQHISMNASARYDSNSDFDNDLSYRAGVSYAMTPQWRLFASYGAAVRNPTFTERYGFFPGSFIGNPDLTPESVTTTEVGVEYSSATGLIASLNGYHSDLEDEINGFVFDPVGGGFTAANSDNESERSGVEFALQQTWSQLSLALFYSYVDADEANATGTAVTELRRPAHTGSVTLNYALTQLPLNINVKADYTGSREDQFFPPFPQSPERVGLRPYTLVNASVIYAIDDSASIQLSATNLFDETYEDIVGFVGKPQQIRLGVTYLW
ncbi:TonB-dependent receptor plug domain-containing protein [Alteromonas oceanisediminis]|uniref:TonB-dependent receptor plug domain-containing protein n=1 Tax=Alteromonas oceanisediminis TaxID=2836180 RepID=UPI001BDA1A99|nr:TonB-dependent receptor [Alteromonas oceanisediminis]MBT0585329.1 TonB-dependent receptor [Alteromonas oceanisediminis]